MPHLLYSKDMGTGYKVLLYMVVLWSILLNCAETWDAAAKQTVHKLKPPKIAFFILSAKPYGAPVPKRINLRQ